MISNNNIFRNLLIFLILFTLFMTSCDFNSGGLGNYYVGKDGLILEFVQGAPPTRVYSGERFEVHTTLKNVGAYNINGTERAKLTIGYDPFTFLSSEKYNENLYQTLYGKNSDNPAGDWNEFVLERFYANNLFGNFERRPSNIYVKLCYPYQTTFVEEVCMDMSFDQENLREQVCEAKALKFNDGQGAPVAVTKITPRMVPFDSYIQPEYEIEVTNLGEGIVFEPLMKFEGNYEVCHENAALNVIDLKAELMGEEMECIPENITLIDGVGTASCRFKSNTILKTSSNFYSSLHIYLNYNYESTYVKEMEVTRRDDLVFSNFNQEKRCQYWEVETADGSCISKCEYCSQNPDEENCKVLDEENPRDKTRIEADFSCIYSREECLNANKVTLYTEFFGDVKHNCIQQENFCPPDTYCGATLCKLPDNQYPPRVVIGDLTSVALVKPTSIYWYGVDDNDQVTKERTGLFSYGNRYPDMERSCGIQVNSNTKIPQSYFKFVEKKEDCPLELSSYTLTESIYDYPEPYPPLFEADIRTNSTGHPYDYVCIRVVDKQGNQQTVKFLIEKTSTMTRLNDVKTYKYK